MSHGESRSAGPTDPMHASDAGSDAARTHEIAHAIREMLERSAEAELLEYCSGMHASDLADLLEHLDDDQRLRLLELLPAPMASDALVEMEEEEHPEDLLVRMEPERIAELVEELADDDAADLIGELEADEQERVLEAVPDLDADEIRELLEFPEDSAGGIMTRELLAVRSTATAAEAIDHIRQHAEDREDFFTIFVTDPDGRMRGVVTLRRLVLASPGQPIAEILEEAPAHVRVDMDQEGVVRILSKYNLASIGVVDADERLVGRITFDDVIDVVEAETTEDILRFASVSDEELVRGGIGDAVRSRLPWLAVNAFTLAMAGLVVWAFQDTIQRLVVLAAVMPVLAGIGGNAGTQALAVTIRRIATSDETLTERWSVVGKELVVGVINGLAVGLLVGIGAFLLQANVRLGIVVMIAMWANMVIASTAGAFFPILLESLGVDPAVASSIFVTTFTDLFGFLLLLGLATTVLL